MPASRPNSATGGAAHRTLKVGDQEAGTRLDRWLVDRIEGVSRSEVQRRIRSGLVWVNEKSVKSGYTLQAGDDVTLAQPPDQDATPLASEALALKILYQDSDLAVIDKPAGIVVHPSAGHARGTLVNALLHHLPDLGRFDGELRPGIVHRLDKDTSGLMVVAKHPAALRDLQAQFKARTVYKEYLALVEGAVASEEAQVDAPIGRHPTDRKRQAAFPPNQHHAGIRVREASTLIRRLAVYTAPVRDAVSVGHFSLVAAMPKTGRTHQIRVHLAWLKHPIVGDPLYGLKRPRLPVPRLFLHAHRLGLRLPSSHEERWFVSPLPAELQSVVDSLAA